MFLEETFFALDTPLWSRWRLGHTTLWHMNTLFGMGFKRKTSETSGEELAAAASAREKQEASDVTKLRAMAAEMQAVVHCSGQLLPTLAKKELSRTPDAVRKRNGYAAKKQHVAAKAERERKRQGAVPPEPEATGNGSGIAKDRENDCEKETHYMDVRGRKRKRKTMRSRAELPGSTGKRGQRVFNDTEKELVLKLHEHMTKRTVGKVSFGALTKELQRKYSSLFGVRALGLPKGIKQQTVRWIVLQHEKAVQANHQVSDERGRPSTLPNAVVLMIIAAFTAVLSARSTVVSAPMLQPIAIGIIMASGHASLLNQGRQKRGRFCCGLDYIRGIMKDRGWTCVKPQGDTRKLPDGWAAL
jgi:hypothetical protein